MNPTVAKVINSYPAPVRAKVMAMRALILATAASTDGVGAREETLKWGEPAYLTSRNRPGSTVHLAWRPSAPGTHVHLSSTRRPLMSGGDRCAFQNIANRASDFAIDAVAKYAARHASALRSCTSLT